VSDGGEKGFEPTPARIEKAKREGDVARAGELGANAGFLAAVACAIAIAPWFGAVARDALARAARGDGTNRGALWMLLSVAAAPGACAAAFGAAMGVLQSGGLRLVPVAIKFARLNPVEGTKRTLSRESAWHGLRAIAAFAVSATVLAPAVASVLGASGAGGLEAWAAAAWTGAQRTCSSACAVGLAFSLLELAQARRSWLRRLRMSFSELKRESKEQDGDPHARGRRRTLHRDFVRGAIVNVKKAAFVVVNPTHVAVALDYRPPDVPVPCVVVRAEGAGALRVRRLAAEHGVPVIENAWLARALYAESRVGDAIPHAHYVAVAEVVSALMRAGDLPETR
jgi:flagellar biosynthesis protein FlhB